MDNSLSFLFGNATTTAKVVDKPPPAENDVFKIPTRIIDRVMDNYYVGDGTVHPGDHLLFIHELCGLFKCAGITTDQVKKKLFSLSLKGRAEEWYKLLKNGQALEWEEIVPLFYSKFYPPSEIHKDRNQIYNFWPLDGESTAQAWGRLKLLMLKCPIHELPNNIIINNFYARLSLHDKDLLDASCAGSFTRMEEEAKWDLLDRIQDNAEAWENDKGRKSGINYDYECIESFMGTDDFQNIKNAYGLDSQAIASYFKAFASYIEVPKKKWNKYHEPYKDVAKSVPARNTEVYTANHVLPKPYIEKMPFPVKIKEHSMIASMVNESTNKAVEPDKQMVDEPIIANVKDFVTKYEEEGHTILCKDTSNIVSQSSVMRASIPVFSVRISDHCYDSPCDSYIVKFMHDTESYYERGKSVLMYLNNIKFPRFMLKVFMLHFFCLLMQVASGFNNLFVYKIPLHRKWVRLKCVCFCFLMLSFASIHIPM